MARSSVVLEVHLPLLVLASGVVERVGRDCRLGAPPALAVDDEPLLVIGARHPLSFAELIGAPVVIASSIYGYLMGIGGVGFGIWSGTIPATAIPPAIHARLRQVYDLSGTGPLDKLRNPGTQEECEYGFVTGNGGFHEFVVFDRSSKRLHSVVASDNQQDARTARSSADD